MTGALPRISVIIPCFNLGAYLDEAVDSVLSQSVRDFEVLILDDGSTDPGTVALLENYQRAQTRVFRTENRGLARARNFLIGHARGQFLCALDADDKLHPEYFARTLSAFEADPTLAFVSTRLQMFGDEDRIWPDTARCDLPAMLADVTVITASLVRLDAVRAIGGYDEEMPIQGDEDWDLWLRLLESGFRGTILPEVLFFYRRRGDSMSVEASRGHGRLASIAYLVNKHKASYQAHFLPVLLSREAEISGLRRAVVSLEAEIAGTVEPAIERREKELVELRGRLDRIREEARMGQPVSAGGSEDAALRELAAQGQRARAEVEELRTSASWRLTAPLRAIYDVLRSLRSWRT